MPRFGVFFVPPARSPFFRLGTSVIGYDARQEAPTHADNFIRAQLPNFDEDYIKRPYKHGIHCTVVAPQVCRTGDLTAISYEIERCLNCFAQETQFILDASSELVDFWGKKQQIVVLKYQANPAMLMLHTLLIAQLISYAMPKTTLPTQSAPHEYHRIHHFNMPFLFDGFTPHFTLMFPYKGTQHQELQDTLYSIFGQFQHLLVDSLCLMTQPDKKSHWSIYKEYALADYPQQP